MYDAYKKVICKTKKLTSSYSNELFFWNIYFKITNISSKKKKKIEK